MRFSPEMLDEIRARLPVSQVVSRHVRLKKAGREFVGLSPFKQEKTPSFTVNDEKGFYHCFSTGEHGDIFTFLIKVEGLAFFEAVEKLAAEAGVELPQSSPQQREREDTRLRLREVLEASCLYYQNALNASGGLEALSYLQRRGLSAETIVNFRLGYAPAGRDMLKQHLLKLGFDIEEILTSGMCVGGRDIAVPYDRFRERVMFPIEDLKGNVIAFGGRALSKAQKAKYLNSPETPLFHKGRLLYNIAKARRTAYDKGLVIAVEGYMDAIACATAGHMNTVAPLGTALTGDQIALMWRLAKEPVLCFDGDEAGRKAAWRAIDTALPLLTPGFSLRFAFLPEGLDPDDLIKNAGAEAFSAIIDKAAPLVDVLWRRELAATPTDTPERRAAFEARINEEIGKIGNEFVKTHYEKDARSRLWELWKGGRGGGRQSGAANNRFGAPGRSLAAGAGKWRAGKTGKAAWMDEPSPASEQLRSSTLVRAANSGGASSREVLMLQAALNHPWLLEDYSEELAELSFSRNDLAQLRDALLLAQIDYCGENGLDREDLRVHLNENGYGEQLVRLEREVLGNDRWVRDAELQRDVVVESWRQMIGMYRRMKALQRELLGAERAFFEEASEENFDRVKDLNAHFQEANYAASRSGATNDDEPLDDYLRTVLKQNGLSS